MTMYDVKECLVCGFQNNADGPQFLREEESGLFICPKCNALGSDFVVAGPLFSDIDDGAFKDTELDEY